MSNRNRQRQIRIRGIRRDPPDVQKLGRALLALALEKAKNEADAQSEHEKSLKEDSERAA